MRRSLILVFLAVFVFVFSGCGKTVDKYALENMSEATQTYFYGEEDFAYASLAVGTREKDYLMDGKSSSCVDFSLLSVVFNENAEASTLFVNVFINDKKTSIEMEYNSFSGAFMFDLEQKVEENSLIVVETEDVTIHLTNVSKDFGVGWKKAISIGCENLENVIKKNISYNNFGAECYLKVMDKKVNEFEDFFWCFTILTENGESFSVIISTVDGRVLAKTK